MRSQVVGPLLMGGWCFRVNCAVRGHLSQVLTPNTGKMINTDREQYAPLTSLREVYPTLPIRSAPRLRGRPLTDSPMGDGRCNVSNDIPESPSHVYFICGRIVFRGPSQ